MKEKEERDEDEDEEAVEIEEAINAAGFGKFQIMLLAPVGLIYSLELCQIQLLGILGHRLQCEWRLSETQRAAISTVGFTGFFVGDLVLGPLSDRIGRRDLLCLGGIMAMLYSLLSSIAPTYLWLLVLQFISSFWIGGMVPSLVSCVVEFTPARWRGATWYVVAAFSGFGNVLQQLIAWPILYNVANDWRLLLLILATLYVPLTALIIFWMPRSPRFCLVSGKPKEAVSTIQRMAAFNGNEVNDSLKLKTAATQSGESGNLLLLFHPKILLKDTLIVMVIMVCAGFTYFCTIELAVQIPVLQAQHCRYFASIAKTSMLQHGCSACQKIDFAEMILPSLADPLGLLVTTLLLEPFVPSRRAALVGGFALVACLLPALSICAPPAAVAAIFFCTRAATSGLYGTVQLVASEYFPTSLRSTSLAVVYGFVRSSMIVSPLLTQLFVPQVSAVAGCCILSGLCALAGICSLLLLRRNTKGRAVEQTLEEWLRADPKHEDQLLKGHSAAGDKVGKSDEAKDDYGSLAMR